MEINQIRGSAYGQKETFNEFGSQPIGDQRLDIGLCLIHIIK